MSNSNSWKCTKCGRYFYQDYMPGCCDNCGGHDFLRVGFKSSNSGISFFGNGLSGFFNALFYEICLFFFTILFTVIRRLFSFLSGTIRNLRNNK